MTGNTAIEAAWRELDSLPDLDPDVQFELALLLLGELELEDDDLRRLSKLLLDDLNLDDDDIQKLEALLTKGTTR